VLVYRTDPPTATGDMTYDMYMTLSTSVTLNGLIPPVNPQPLSGEFIKIDSSNTHLLVLAHHAASLTMLTIATINL
jgi:hypothetical protein